MKTFVNNLNSHPAVALLLSLLGIGTGTGLHHIHPAMQIMTQSTPVFVLDLIVKIFQIFAYAGGGLAGFIAFHGWGMKHGKRWWNKKTKNKR